MDFGKENHSHVTSDLMRSFLTSHYRGIVRYIKHVYFNDNVPANRTIQYDPQDLDNLLIIDNGELRRASKHYVLDTIMIDTWKRMVDYFNALDSPIAFKESLVCEETFYRIESFLETYRDICKGNPSIAYKDVRDDVIKMIKLYTETTKPKKKVIRKKKQE
jgi:hypothetical protein